MSYYHCLHGDSIRDYFGQTEQIFPRFLTDKKQGAFWGDPVFEILVRYVRSMQIRGRTNQFWQKGLTLVELVISMALVVIVFSAILPQFRVMYRSLDLRQASAETLQNSRIFSEHIGRLLAQAENITAVSAFADNNGYIEFVGSDGNNYRCDCSDSYIRFGLTGQQQVMAGPVGGLRFTCYALSDLNTPITVPASIDYIRVDTTFTDSTGYNQNEAISANVMLARTSASSSLISPLVHLELDEGAGLVAGDSSGSGLSGQMHFSSPNPWCEGIDGNDSGSCEPGLDESGNGSRLDLYRGLQGFCWDYSQGR
jgi:prepilin-type N-terminal cleavage/methylation domain-containing protein